MNISKALKRCRKEKGYTKTKLAGLSGLSISYLTLLEQGKREPNMSSIEDICRALQIPVSLFIFLASDQDEIKGISKELADKLSVTALRLMNADDD